MNNLFQEQLNYAKEFIPTLPWENERFYANFLAQTYYFVCHSTRLLGRSMSYFVHNQEDLYRRFKDHISEEDAHEKIALSDLKKLGYEIAQFPELAVTKSFYECQYFKIERSLGTALLGYILYLETVAVHAYPLVVDRLYKKYDKKCCQFLKVHVEEDPDHVEKALLEISKLPSNQQSEIWQNFWQTSKLYCQLLKDAQQEQRALDFSQAAS